MIVRFCACKKWTISDKFVKIYVCKLMIIFQNLMKKQK